MTQPRPTLPSDLPRLIALMHGLRALLAAYFLFRLLLAPLDAFLDTTVARLRESSGQAMPRQPSLRADRTIGLTCHACGRAPRRRASPHRAHRHAIAPAAPQPLIPPLPPRLARPPPACRAETIGCRQRTRTPISFRYSN